MVQNGGMESRCFIAVECANVHPFIYLLPLPLPYTDEIRKCITCTDQIGPSHPFTQTTHSYAHLIWSITSHQFWHLDSWGLDIGPLGSSMMWRRRQSTSLNFISHRRIKLQVSLPVRAVSYWEDEFEKKVPYYLAKTSPLITCL